MIDETLSQALLELLKTVKDVSPMIWEALLRQNTLYGLGNIIFGTLLLILSIAGILFAQKYFTAKRIYDSEFSKYRSADCRVREKLLEPEQPELLKRYDEFAAGITGLASLLGTLAGTLTLYYGTMYLANPNFWAMSLLIDQLN